MKLKIGISLSEDLLMQLDKKRELASRSAFVEYVLREGLGMARQCRLLPRTKSKDHPEKTESEGSG
jgi:metal-responsive CopG/Arc/MetJ family transcriptional regulator